MQANGPPPNNVDTEQIPDELKDLQQWVCWQLEETDKGTTKVPKVAWSRKANASTTNSKTWTAFTTAFEHFSQGHHNGVGFVFSANDPYCGIDLDSCRNPETGHIEQWAEDILKDLNSYSEVSQSGKGIHIIVKAELPGTGTKKTLPGTEHEVEIYNRDRYFCTTGRRLENYPAEVRECQDEVLKLYHALKSPVTSQKGAEKPIQRVSPALSDENVVKLASEAKNGDKFQRLMDGDSRGYQSESEADAGLAAIIGFYTQDYDQILRIIQQSGLWDEKWEREDYQERTINGALAKLTEYYQAPREKKPKRRPKARPSEDKADQTPAPVEFNLEQLTPPLGFLRDYMEYMTPLSEAPDHFHLFCGLVLVSTFIGKSVFYSIAGQKKYPNLWLVLVAPSGVKKSTSINAARRLVMDADMKDRNLPNQFTSEILIPTLAKNPAGTFFWAEWGATMDQWGKSYSVDIMSIMTSLFDDGYFSRWLKAEKYEIDGASINLLCGCTPSWLKKAIKQADISMGFWPRFLFVPAQERTKYLPMPPRGSKTKHDELIRALKAIHDSIPAEEEYAQEADFSNVEGIYGRWYIQTNKEADEAIDDSHTSFIQRLTDYAKKIAILVEISRDGQDQDTIAVAISPESMGYAIKLVDWLTVTSRQIIRAATQSEKSELEESILDFIRTCGNEGALRRDIAQRFWRKDTYDITIALENLEVSEWIGSEKTNTQGRGRVGKKYFPRE